MRCGGCARPVDAGSGVRASGNTPTDDAGETARDDSTTNDADETARNDSRRRHDAKDSSDARTHYAPIGPDGQGESAWQRNDPSDHDYDAGDNRPGGHDARHHPPRSGHRRWCCCSAEIADRHARDPRMTIAGARRESAAIVIDRIRWRVFGVPFLGVPIPFIILIALFSHQL
jgi:hypothetical protein